MASPNIFNETTGQTGYQVPGAAIPAGWKAGAPPAPSAPTVPTPAPTPTPTPAPTLVDRYAGQQSAIDTTYGLTPNPGADDTTIRNGLLNDAQSSIDAINAKYASIDKADQDTIDQMNREQNASNVLNGLTGSDAAVGRTIQTSKAGDTIKEKDAASQENEIQGVLSNVDTRASTEYQTEKNAYIANAKDKLTAETALQDKEKANALSEIKTMAANGSFTDLQKSNPTVIQQWMKETGMDAGTLQATFAASAPDGTYQWSESQITPQGIIVPHVVGNKATLETIPVPAGTQMPADPKNVEVIKGDNGIYMIDKSTGKATLIGGTGSGSGGYTMSAATKNNLYKFAVSATEASQMESDIRQYGLSKVLANIKDPTTRAQVQSVLDPTYQVDTSGNGQ